MSRFVKIHWMRDWPEYRSNPGKTACGLTGWIAEWGSQFSTAEGYMLYCERDQKKATCKRCLAATLNDQRRGKP